MHQVFLVQDVSYSITFLLSVVLVFDSAGATPPNRGLLNGQKAGTTQRNAFRAAAEQALQEGFQLYRLGTAESRQKAIDKWFEALQLWQQLNDLAKQAITLNNIGLVYSDLGDLQKALEYYNQALPLRRAVGDKSEEATTLTNIGVVYDALGEKPKALEYYNQALLLFRAVGNKSGEAVILTSIGGVYSDEGEKQRALEYYNQALPLRRAVGNKSGEAVTLTNIGLVYDDLGEKQKALEYYNQALPLRRAVGYKFGEAVTLSNVAYIKRNIGNFQQALTQIQAAVNIIENLRSFITNKKLRTSYFASVQGYYQFYIDLLMQLHKKDPQKVCEINIAKLYYKDRCDAVALHISERSRARILTELLTEAHADIRNGVEPKLLATEQHLQQLIDSKAAKGGKAAMLRAEGSYVIPIT
ncbi:MAG: tetratricopeptide repeat protein, partial [Rhizonema sp. PD38]|nr:tetratricopeptide repeat protein [Rhizonema sp. PD38]